MRREERGRWAQMARSVRLSTRLGGRARVPVGAKRKRARERECVCVCARVCARVLDAHVPPTVCRWCVQLESGGDGAAFQATLDDMTSAMKLYGQVCFRA